MIYRPQFAFGGAGLAPDEQFHYSFDSGNVPVLGHAIAAGGSVNNITLQLQNDAEFILRGVKFSASNLAVQIKSPYDEYLSATYLPISRYVQGSGLTFLGSLFVPFESEIRCPVGGSLQLFLYNPTAAPITPGAVTLYGLNRGCRQ